MDFVARITRLPIPADPARGLSALQATGIADPRLGELIRGAAGCSPYLAGLIEREADWLTGADLTHFVLFDASTSGNVLASGELDTPKPVLDGDTISFAAGALDVSLD